MPTSTEIQYRWLDGEELALLEPTLRSMNAMSLNRDQARAIGAFDGDRLIGFFVVQLIPHLEPLYVDPQYRSQPIGLNMVMEMVSYLKNSDARGAMLVAEHPSVEKLAEFFGMERITFPMYSKINMGGGL